MTVLRGVICSKELSILSSIPIKINTKEGKEGETHLTIDVSERDFTDFDLQVSDTIMFLNSNKKSLILLNQSLPDIQWQLDIGISPLIISKDVAVENLTIPIELINLCCQLEIELNISLYDFTIP